MTKRDNLNIWTNLAFLIPATLSLYYKIYWHLTFILLLLVFSILFHLKKEKILGRLDTFFAMVLIFSNSYLLYLSGFATVYTTLIIFFIIIAFIFFYRAKNKRYELNHALWHLSSVIVTVLCILAYTKNY